MWIVGGEENEKKKWNQNYQSQNHHQVCDLYPHGLLMTTTTLAGRHRLGSLRQLSCHLAEGRVLVLLFLVE